MEDRRRRRVLYGISGGVLLLGLSSAFLIYRAAARAPAADDAGDPFSPEDSKQNLRQLEYYGGGANVLAYEIRLWFLGLWHGKSLACMVAGATILLSVGCFYAAAHPP